MSLYVLMLPWFQGVMAYLIVYLFIYCTIYRFQGLRESQGTIHFIAFYCTLYF